MGAGDVLVHALPLYHQHGLGGVHATLIAGATAHIRSRFLAAAIVETVQASGASVLLGVPTMYQALLNAAGRPVRARGRPAGGRGWAAGAAGPAAGRLRFGSAEPGAGGSAAGLLGRHPLVRYGTTETGLDISHPYGPPPGGTIGVPLPGVLARIWSGERRTPCRKDGEIQLRGPQVFDGYWHDPEATTAAFTEDGWFRSGDIGRVDPASGHMMIRGRIKELIITGGINVYPHEVETALESHPSIAEAVVAGVPHKHWGEQVTGWVVLRPGCDLTNRR